LIDKREETKKPERSEYPSYITSAGKIATMKYFNRSVHLLTVLC